MQPVPQQRLEQELLPVEVWQGLVEALPRLVQESALVQRLELVVPQELEPALHLQQLQLSAKLHRRRPCHQLRCEWQLSLIHI